MSDKQVKWAGPQRELPGQGVVEKGDIVTLPDHMAKSYVYQGLANYVNSKAIKAGGEK